MPNILRESDPKPSFNKGGPSRSKDHTADYKFGLE